MLDIARATEAPSIAGGVLAPINGLYRHGAAGSFGDLIGSGEEFPETFDGPSFAWGWEQAIPLLGPNPLGLSGPASFSVGTIELVLRELGTTTLSFFIDPNHPWSTVVGDLGFVDTTGNVVFEDLDLAAIDFGSLSMTVVVVPEPGTALLVGVGLTGLAALAPRARRGR